MDGISKAGIWVAAIGIWVVAVLLLPPVQDELRGDDPASVQATMDCSGDVIVFDPDPPAVGTRDFDLSPTSVFNFECRPVEQ